LGHDGIEESFAFVWGKFFGVIDSRDEQAGGKDDRSRNNRPGQWAAACLVYAGDHLKSVPESLPLK
jgi:hypothetical protein